MLKTSVLVGALFIGAATLCQGSPSYYLATDQTGAQTQIDVNHTSAWLFVPNIDFSFGGGLFAMKAGSGAADDVTFALYQGTNATGTLLGSVVLTNTVFCAQVANCGQFNNHQFFFGVAIPVLTGTSYFATLTSPALDTQSTAYFIKSDNSFVSDVNGTPINPQPVGGVGVVSTPEPATFALIGLGLMALAIRTKRVSG
jgi:hypothetical protein